MRQSLWSACAAAVACIALTGAAQSAPLGAFRSAVGADVSKGEVQAVTYRSSRYCRWHDGERHCYNRRRGYGNDRYYGYNDYYGGGTGIYLNFGGRRHGHRRDWDRNDRVDNGLSFGQGHRRIR